MCVDLERAGVPNQGKWRSLILYFRSLGDQAHLEQDQQKDLQQLVIRTIQARDYSDQCYRDLIQNMQDIINTPLQRKLQEALLETMSIANEYSSVLSKNKNRVSDLGENTVRDIESGVDPETMIENIRSSFREVVAGMEADIASLRAITDTDGLTGLFNRRALDAFLSEMLDKNGPENHRLQFFLLDLDHFKKVNDTFGHPVGDYVLKTVAEILKQPGEAFADQSERVYFPARYGGEEFAICLSGFTFDEGVELIEKLRETIKSTYLSAEADNGKQMQIQLTVSAGMAEGNPQSENPASDILHRADKALYKAKRNGRDQLAIENTRS
ncbi:GGDEF domain-containing protein [Desulfovibrio sp. JC010]|uniref:GGDEF domain-containing protein n=1 Tax=Desulfovibrio sp. JC010 TaxID=2593641 RepID=UPI0013D7B5B6|nr:GGDEF domain-containing protein [Desulfovibrio sp. JC010]